MLKHFAFIIFTLLQLSATAQKQAGAELDNYILPGNGTGLVPTIYYQGNKDWLTMMRYNYEEDQTLSVYGGKTFSKRGNLHFNITPLAGFQIGKLNGLSAGSRIESETRKFSFYSEPQYCFSFQTKERNFFYAWTELSFALTNFSYAGLALQQTKLFGAKLVNAPGMLAGLNFGNFDIPVYYFKSSETSYFIVGLHWALKKS